MVGADPNVYENHTYAPESLVWFFRDGDGDGGGDGDEARDAPNDELLRCRVRAYLCWRDGLESSARYDR